MKKVLGIAAMAAMLWLAFGADAATQTKKKAPVKKGAAKTTTPAKKSPAKKGTAAAAAHKKAPAKKAVTWRNRQTTPSPERYHEIQGALVAKGYLKSEDANGSWSQNSVDALKKFQSEQNLEASGKINSLSLIALGLGPKRDSATATVAPPKPPQ